jgi:hypothetical protein
MDVARPKGRTARPRIMRLGFVLRLGAVVDIPTSSSRRSVVHPLPFDERDPAYEGANLRFPTFPK